jgi:hypothetical protein
VVEAKLEQRLAGHIDLLAVRQHRSHSTRRRTSARSNGSTLSFARNRTDHRAQRSAPTVFLAVLEPLPFVSNRTLSVKIG